MRKWYDKFAEWMVGIGIEPYIHVFVTMFIAWFIARVSLLTGADRMLAGYFAAFLAFVIGFVKEGELLIAKSGTYYKMDITWFNLEEGLYGLKMEQNEEGKWQFVKPYEFTSRFDRTYMNYPTSSTSKRKAQPIPFDKKQIENLLNNRSKYEFSKK